MWRMNYSILTNIKLMLRLIEQMHRMVDQPENYSEEDRYDYAHYIVGLMQKSGHIKTECFGAENLPAEGGYVMYPNHQGQYDTYGLVSAHEKPIGVVINRERSYSTFVSEVVDMINGKRMDIEDARHGLKIINEVAQEVAAGRRYVIFPEGTYENKDPNDMLEFKPGCFKAAQKVGAPMVPVVLVNSHKPYNSRTLLPVKTQVHFLPPIYKEEYQEMNTFQIADLVKSRIRAKQEELGCR